MRCAVLLLATLSLVASACAQEEPHPGWQPEPGDLDPDQNIALEKPVTYAPDPNYGLTSAGGTDPTDLTDGVLSDHPRGHLWFQSKCVGWSYGGLGSLMLDLGQIEPIREVAMRIQGGSPQAGICTPVWMEVVVSDDGESWRRVGEYSTFRAGDDQRFGVPAYEGVAWVHRFRFTDLATRGRYVGISLYGAGLTVADEMYVFRGDHDPDAVSLTALPETDFSVTRPHMALHKPYLCFTTNVTTPNPVGLLAPTGHQAEPVTIILDLPPGTRLVAGDGFGRGEEQAPLAEIAPEQTDDGWTRYQFAATAGENTKTWGRLFIGGDWADGQEGELRYATVYADGTQTPLVSVPLRAIEVPATPQPQRLLVGLSWYSLGALMSWPNAIDDYRALGLNTVNTMVHWMRDVEANQELWDFWEQCRDAGFKLQNIDSTFHQMPDQPETRCQLADGTTSSRRCPSYRGQYYQAEIERVARQCALARPHALFADIEIWNWQGPVDAEKCTRCQADFARSGLESWEEWKLAKGFEMWRDVVEAVRAAVSDAGGPEMEFGVYDWRAGQVYQFTWPFDRLYPEYLQSSQPSTYTPLYPYHIAMVGDEARRDRQRLPRADVILWLTPGDAGTFSGERFRYALLECFANGARGMQFWSGRVWDAELLAAYARVIRNLAPVEDVLADGELLEGAQVQGAGRISGVVAGGEMVILVADYLGETEGTVTVTLPVAGAMTATDLDTGETLQVAADGTLAVPLGGEMARLLHVRRRVGPD
ncbi:MAG: hypothetical protein AB7Y46_13380 [Armatimonadota bacterium]